MKGRIMFSGTYVNVTSAGKRHLGAVIGSQEYKDEYVNELVTRWSKELPLLSRMPRRNYTAHVHMVFNVDQKLPFEQILLSLRICLYEIELLE